MNKVNCTRSDCAFEWDSICLHHNTWMFFDGTIKETSDCPLWKERLSREVANTYRQMHDITKQLQRIETGKISIEKEKIGRVLDILYNKLAALSQKERRFKIFPDTNISRKDKLMEKTSNDKKTEIIKKMRVVDRLKLSEATGISYSYLSNIILGYAPLTVRNEKKIATALETLKPKRKKSHGTTISNSGKVRIFESIAEGNSRRKRRPLF